MKMKFKSKCIWKYCLQCGGNFYLSLNELAWMRNNNNNNSSSSKQQHIKTVDILQTMISLKFIPQAPIHNK